MRRTLRKLAWRVMPAAMADRAHRYQTQLEEEYGLMPLSREFVARNGDRILRGPFEGMRYPAGRVGSMSRRLGAYERELYPWLEQAFGSRPARFIDIGAADGFYAVGAALRGVPVEAFEMARTARGEIEELAALNGVKVNIHGTATAQAVARLPLERALVLSDCEGAEGDIFTPELAGAMGSATLIIEVHEGARPGVLGTLERRFSATHEITLVQPEERSVDDYPELAQVPEASRPWAIGEARAKDTPWMVLQPRADR